MPTLESILPKESIQRIIEGRENEGFDLKRDFKLDTDKEKRDFAKDICAIANSRGRKGYIIIGVTDRKHRKKGAPSIPGIAVVNDEAFEQQIVSMVENHCEAYSPNIEAELCDFQSVKIGVVSVLATSKPHVLRGAKTVWIRKGTQNVEASIREVEEMVKSRYTLDGYNEIYKDFLDLSEEDSEYEMRVFFEFIVKKLKKDLDNVTDIEKHKFYYTMARSYFAMNDHQSCMDAIDSSLAIKENTNYYVLKAKNLYYWGKSHYDEANKLEDCIEMQINSIKETELLEAQRKAEDAKHSLDSAIDMGSNLPEYTRLGRYIDKLLDDTTNLLELLADKQCGE